MQDRGVPIFTAMPADAWKIMYHTIDTRGRPTLASALLVVQGWLLRHRDQTIRVKVGDDEIEIPRDVDPEVALNLAERLKGMGRPDTGHTPAGPAG